VSRCPGVGPASGGRFRRRTARLWNFGSPLSSALECAANGQSVFLGLARPDCSQDGAVFHAKPQRPFTCIGAVSCASCPGASISRPQLCAPPRSRPTMTAPGREQKGGFWARLIGKQPSIAALQGRKMLLNSLRMSAARASRSTVANVTACPWITAVSFKETPMAGCSSSPDATSQHGASPSCERR